MSEAIPGELTRAAQQVFSSMFGLSLTPNNGQELPNFPPERKVSAAVGISGDWNGAVLFECSSNTACHLASIMLGGDPPPAVDEDVKDVIGEITNMVAGNFKNTLDGHSVLTLPCVVEGADYTLEIIQGKRVLTEALLFDGEWIILSVVRGNGRR